MPTVAVVFGMAILFYYEDHEPPHFHVRAANFKAKISLGDLSVSEVSGQMRPQDFARLREWAGQHRPELYENWIRARQRKPVIRIEDERR